MPGLRRQAPARQGTRWFKSRLTGGKPKPPRAGRDDTAKAVRSLIEESTEPQDQYTDAYKYSRPPDATRMTRQPNTGHWESMPFTPEVSAAIPKKGSPNSPSSYWIDPDGKTFKVDYDSHDTWIEKNKTMLSKEYGITDIPDRKRIEHLVEKGWTRISYMGQNFSILVEGPVDKIPQEIKESIIFSDNVLVTYPRGEMPTRDAETPEEKEILLQASGSGASWGTDRPDLIPLNPDKPRPAPKRKPGKVRDMVERATEPRSDEATGFPPTETNPVVYNPGVGTYTSWPYPTIISLNRKLFEQDIKEIQRLLKLKTYDLSEEDLDKLRTFVAYYYRLKTGNSPNVKNKSGMALLKMLREGIEGYEQGLIQEEISGGDHATNAAESAVE